MVGWCSTSPPTQYRSYGRRFLQVKRSNQQYQSTEGKSYKGKTQKTQTTIDKKGQNIKHNKSPSLH